MYLRFRVFSVGGAEFDSRRVPGVIPVVHGVGVFNVSACDSGACTDRLPSEWDMVCHGLTAAGAELDLKRVPSLKLDMDGAGVLDADVGGPDVCTGASSVIFSINPLVVVGYSLLTMDGAGVLDADVGGSDACTGASSVIFSINPLVVVGYSLLTVQGASGGSSFCMK
jgi:hypothetical protein